MSFSIKVLKELTNNNNEADQTTISSASSSSPLLPNPIQIHHHRAKKVLTVNESSNENNLAAIITRPNKNEKTESDNDDDENDDKMEVDHLEVARHSVCPFCKENYLHYLMIEKNDAHSTNENINANSEHNRCSNLSSINSCKNNNNNNNNNHKHSIDSDTKRIRNLEFVSKSVIEIKIDSDENRKPREANDRSLVANSTNKIKKDEQGNNTDRFNEFVFNFVDKFEYRNYEILRNHDKVLFKNIFYFYFNNTKSNENLSNRELSNEQKHEINSNYNNINNSNANANANDHFEINDTKVTSFQPHVQSMLNDSFSDSILNESISINSATVSSKNLTESFKEANKIR
jgi:hypothetical protein